MIIAGQGVLYAEATDELLALAELLDIPVMTTIDGKSAFPEDHALALGSGGVVYTGHGRHFLLESRRGLRDRHAASPGTTSRPRSSRPARRSSTPPTTRATCYKANDTAIPILGDAKLVLAQFIEAVKDRLGGKAARDRRAASASPI